MGLWQNIKNLGSGFSGVSTGGDDYDFDYSVADKDLAPETAVVLPVQGDFPEGGDVEQATKGAIHYPVAGEDDGPPIGV